MMELGVVITIAIFILGIICGVIGFFLKRTFNRVDILDQCKASKEDLAAMEERVENRLSDHNRKIDDIKANYVTKEDFRLLKDDLIRALGNTEQKVDRLIDFLMKRGGGSNNG